jgi:predicted Zn-dependent protease
VTPVGTARTQVLRAGEAFAAGRNGQALQLARAALGQGQNTCDVHLLLGRIHLAMAHPREAAEAFHLAATLRPTAETLGLEGGAWHTAGQLAQAQVALTRARQLDPGNAEITLRLGLVCLDQGQLAQAEGELRDGLAGHPGHAGLLVALSRLCLAREQPEAAITLLRQVVAKAPNDTPAYVMLGQALVEAGRPAEAARQLESAARRMTDRAEIFSALGQVYRALGRESKARQALQRAAALEASPAPTMVTEYPAWHAAHANPER